MSDTTSASHFIELIDELARTRGRIASVFASGRKAIGLSELEMVVLNAISGAADPPTVPQIGRSLGHARQVIQRAAATLVEKELACWIENPDHKRAHRLTPTVRGRSLKVRADEEGLRVAARLVRHADADQLRQAVETLRGIRRLLEADARASSRDREGS
jgi:DNA-binding MarR family transcriptional regulator